MEEGGEEVVQVGELEADDIRAHSAVDEENVEQVRQRDQHRRNVAQDADLLCQLSQPPLQGAFPLIHLHLPADLPQRGRIPHRRDQQFPAACGQTAPPQQGARVGRLRSVGPQPRRRTAPRALVNLPALPRHGGLVHPRGTVQKQSVRRNRFPGTQQNNVPHNNLRKGNFMHRPASAHAAGRPLPFLRKPCERPLGRTLRQRGNQRCKKNRQPDPRRLNPVRTVKQQEQIDRQRRKQNANHRIIQIPQKLPPERLRFLPGQPVASVRLPRCQDLPVT